MPAEEVQLCEDLLRVADRVVACSHAPGSGRAGCPCRLQLQAALHGSPAALQAMLPACKPAAKSSGIADAGTGSASDGGVEANVDRPMVCVAAQAPGAAGRRIVLVAALAANQVSDVSSVGGYDLAFECVEDVCSLTLRGQSSCAFGDVVRVRFGIVKQGERALADFAMAARDWACVPGSHWKNVMSEGCSLAIVASWLLPGTCFVKETLGFTADLASLAKDCGYHESVETYLMYVCVEPRDDS